MTGPLDVPISDSLHAYEGIRSLLDRGRFEDAQSLLDRLPRPLRDAAPARFLRGLCRLKMGELLAAVSTLEELVAEIPDNGYAYHYMGLVADSRGDTRAATACFLRALKGRTAHTGH
jgi:tetratricopeptide (TPR) repeat protein